MIKFVMYGAFAMMLALPFTSNAKMVNGKKLFDTADFPHGKMLDVNELINLPKGKWQQTVYLVDPIEFKDNGTPNGKGGFVYTGKVHHTIVGDLWVSLINSAASNAVFKITIPYKTPLQKGSVYKFTSAQPLTIDSMKPQTNSNAESFAMFNCTFYGKMVIDGTMYPLSNQQ
jgi:hypothetical protein